MSGQQQTIMTKKKSKCQGNRQLHHFERRCHKNGLDNDTIAKLILHYTPTDRLSDHHIIKE